MYDNYSHEQIIEYRDIYSRLRELLMTGDATGFKVELKSALGRGFPVDYIPPVYAKTKRCLLELSVLERNEDIALSLIEAGAETENLYIHSLQLIFWAIEMNFSFNFFKALVSRMYDVNPLSLKLGHSLLGYLMYRYVFEKNKIDLLPHIHLLINLGADPYYDPKWMRVSSKQTNRIKRRETLINYIAWRKEKLDNLASPQTTAYEYDL